MPTPSTPTQIFGCFISVSSLYSTASELTKREAEQKGKYFRSLIWDGGGFDEQVKRLVNLDYGNDLVLILFQFYINPLAEEIDYLKDIQKYQPKEKSIGVCIIVTDENFFFQKPSRTN